MNELQEEYKSKGLSIVGVTNEPKDKTEAWVAKHKAAFPYAYDVGNKLKKGLKVGGIPAAFLINPRGKVVWKGHPGHLKNSIIEEHIKGANRYPPGIDGLTKDWPESAAPAKKLLKKGKIGQALTTAQKLAVKDQACKVAVETLSGMATGEVAGIKELKEAGDILGALDTAKLAKKSLNGCDLVKEVDALVKEIKADKAASAVVRAQVQLAKIEAKAADVRKKKDVDSVVKKLDKLIAKNADNYAGAQAQKLKTNLLAMKEKMRR